MTHLTEWMKTSKVVSFEEKNAVCVFIYRWIIPSHNSRRQMEKSVLNELHVPKQFLFIFPLEDLLGKSSC